MSKTNRKTEMTRPIDGLKEIARRKSKSIFRNWLSNGYGAPTWPENDRIADKAEEIYGKRIAELERLLEEAREKAYAKRKTKPRSPQSVELRGKRQKLVCVCPQCGRAKALEFRHSKRRKWLSGVKHASV